MAEEVKIYFCGAIKGGRRLVPLYSRIIQRCKKYGVVLTEHVGDANYAKDGYLPATQVFMQDTSWLDGADIVIAEVTVPALGVGYELGRAQWKGKQVHCLYLEEERDKVSSMIIGNPYYHCYSYNTQTLESTIDEIFTKERVD